MNWRKAKVSALPRASGGFCTGTPPGFRLPSALYNRPLKFPEFQERVGQIICTTATPAKFEAEHSEQTVEQVIRPTGLVDPDLIIRPIVEKGKYKGQIRDFIAETFLIGDEKDSFDNADSFMATGIVDSTGILEITVYLETEFDISIDDEEMTPSNLDSVNNLTGFVTRKKG